MLITAVEPRKKSLSALFIEGEFAVNIDTETLIKSGFKAGKDIDDAQLHELIIQSDKRRANEKALYLLERRNHSQKELADKISRVTSREAAEAAAQHMADIGLVNDEEFAKSYTREMFTRKGFSAKRVLYAQTVVEDFAPDPVEKILEIINKKYSKKLSDEKSRRRSIAALQRLGYRWDDIKAALNQFENED